MNNYKSKCCNVGVRVVGGITKHHECRNCGLPCDLADTAPQPTEREMEMAEEFVGYLRHDEQRVSETDGIEEFHTVPTSDKELAKGIAGLLAAQRREHEADLARRREAIEKIPTVAVVGNCIVRTEVLNAFDNPNPNPDDKPE